MQDQSKALSPVPQHFNLFARLLHWGMALAIFAMLFIGVGMMTSLTHRPWLISLHQQLGLTLLCLAVVRLGNRLGRPIPPLHIASHDGRPRQQMCHTGCSTC